MPDLLMPIFNCEPVTSLIGNMLFPNDRGKAMAAASWHLESAIMDAPNEVVQGLDQNIVWGIRAIARDYAKDQAGDAAYRGTQAGFVVSYLWRMPGASLEDAIGAAIDISCGDRLPATRASLFAAKREFAKVLHFWGILSNERQNRWPDNPCLFISQSEILLRVMRQRSVAGDTFRSPKFTIPLSVYNWAVSGRIRIGDVATALLPRHKKPAGRPRKSSAK